ncbi:aminotransferase class V-fold PLP-dependent enzyme [archaeon]|nr:MAG: aminotransferase class V-fold PLP-dependent enzyme [archaeon]
MKTTRFLSQTLSGGKGTKHISLRLSSIQADAVPKGYSIKGEALEGRPAYLDFQATTPLDPRVLDAMMPFYLEKYGNPHSRTHAYGWETEHAIETARENVAKLIGESDVCMCVYVYGMACNECMHVSAYNI